MFTLVSLPSPPLPYLPHTDMHSTPLSMHNCPPEICSKQLLVGDAQLQEQVGWLFPCPQILNVGCMQVAANGGQHQKGHNRPPNPLLLRPFSHPRETQHKNKLLLHTANIKVFFLLADTYFGKCLRCGAQRLGAFIPGITVWLPVSGRNQGLQVGAPGSTGRDDTSIFAADSVTWKRRSMHLGHFCKGSALRAVPKAGSGGIRMWLLRGELCLGESASHAVYPNFLGRHKS